jgi:Tfp pilus assembly protein PilF
MLRWIRAKLGAGRGDRSALLRDAEAALKAGETERARAACLEALRADAGEVRALCLMATIAADERRLDEGLSWAGKALAADPKSAAAHYATGRLWEGAGRYDEAGASYRKAVGLDPSHARAHTNLGVVNHLQGRLDVALACYRRALEIDPQQAEANQNLAGLLGDTGARDTALEGFRRQLAANPRDAAAHGSFAALCLQLGRYAEARAHLEQAIAIEPGRAEPHFILAQLLLQLGDYDQGWKEYEWRWRVPAFNAPALRFPQPLWDGGPLDGPLLIHGETGLGDTLQFVRYARLAAQRVPAVIVESQPALAPLLAGAEGIAQLLSQGEPLPRFAAHIPLIGLPGAFGTTLQTIPWSGPYLRAGEALRARWGARVGPAPLKVGLVWAGNPGHWDDRRRSASLAQLAPLARVPGAVFYSLQKGKPAEQAASPPQGMRLVDLTAEIRDFADTAALISHLDLVVTVDTAVAHLGGALGARTWVMLTGLAEWRWLLEREDSPWYPTMRLFRQERDGDWAGPVGRMAVALEAILRES